MMKTTTGAGTSSTLAQLLPALLVVLLEHLREALAAQSAQSLAQYGAQSLKRSEAVVSLGIITGIR
jgi:hypothetical protein